MNFRKILELFTYLFVLHNKQNIDFSNKLMIKINYKDVNAEFDFRLKNGRIYHLYRINTNVLIHVPKRNEEI